MWLLVKVVAVVELDVVPVELGVVLVELDEVQVELDEVQVVDEQYNKFHCLHYIPATNEKEK